MEAILDNKPYKHMSEHRVTKHILLADEFVSYCPRLPFSTCKCDEMHLRWVFTVQTAVILVKNIFELMFNKARRF